MFAHIYIYEQREAIEGFRQKKEKQKNVIIITIIITNVKKYL